MRTLLFFLLLGISPAFAQQSVPPANAVSVCDPANPLDCWAPTASGDTVLQPGTPDNITISTSTLVKTGAGTFLGLSVNTIGTTSTATVYDGTSAGGTKIGTYSTVLQGGPNIPAGGIAFSTGLFVVTAGAAAADITVVYH
jgi:hypothetical protein